MNRNSAHLPDILKCDPLFRESENFGSALQNASHCMISHCKAMYRWHLSSYTSYNISRSPCAGVPVGRQRYCLAVADDG